MRSCPWNVQFSLLPPLDDSRSPQVGIPIQRPSAFCDSTWPGLRGRSWKRLVLPPLRSPWTPGAKLELLRCQHFLFSGSTIARPRDVDADRQSLHVASPRSPPRLPTYCTSWTISGACPEKLTRNGLLVFPAHVVRIPGGTLRFVRFHSNRSVARCTPIRMSVHGPNTHSKDRTHVRMRHRRL